MEYGLANYQKRDIYEKQDFKSLPVMDGQQDSVGLFCETKKIELLLAETDITGISVELPDSLTAPVTDGSTVGEVVYLVNGKRYASLPVTVTENVAKIDFIWCLEKIAERLFL